MRSPTRRSTQPPASPRRGEVWTIFTGGPDDPHQPRPAVVVSENLRNTLTDSVTLVPAFSRGRLGPTRIPITAGQGGMPHDSMLRCEELTTLHRSSLVRGPLGPPVDSLLLDAVVRGVRRSIGDAVIETRGRG